MIARFFELTDLSHAEKRRRDGEESFFHLPQENRCGKPSPNKATSGSRSISRVNFTAAEIISSFVNINALGIFSCSLTALC